MDDSQFLEELDKLVTAVPEKERVTPPSRPGFWAPDRRFKADGPILETPAERFEPVRRFEPVPEPDDANPDPEPMPIGLVPPRPMPACGVPRVVAAFLVVACMGVGAGGAAAMFHDRVSAIVTAWTAPTR
jgi:hypothetical protein